MEHQEWTIVTIKRTLKKNHSHTRPYTYTQSPSYPYSYSHTQSQSNDESLEYIPKKSVSTESLQELIRKRIELKLNQEKADQLCAFPINTFKNIESKRLIPAEKHQQSIQKNLGVQIRISVISKK